MIHAFYLYAYLCIFVKVVLILMNFNAAKDAKCNLAKKKIEKHSAQNLNPNAYFLVNSRNILL